MKLINIYRLVDPRTGETRYVGKTVQSLSARLAQHLCHRVRQITKCAAWIRSLKKVGIEPEIHLVDAVQEEAWREAEQFWIAEYRRRGARLCNLAIGGEGRHGYALTKAHKAKISASMMGRTFSEKSIEKIRAKKLGKPRPDLALRNRATAKLTEKQVAEIRQSNDMGTVLAARYGVSKALISLIRNSKRR